MDAIWMLGFARNIVFFRVNGGSVPEKSWLARATVSGVAALPWNRLRSARNVTDGFRWLSLLFDDAVLLCFACVETLCALELLHWRDAFTSWPLGSWRRPRTKSSFSSFQLVEFEGSLARKLRFHIFTFGIWRKPRMKSSLSHLQFLESERSLALKLAFCYSVSADRNGMAASRLLLAAAACVILLRFAAESRNRIVMAAWDVWMALWQQICCFGIDDFPFKIPFKMRFKIVVFLLWRRAPVLELQNRSNLWAVVHSSIVFCNSMSADRNAMAASKVAPCGSCMRNTIAFCSWES